MWYDTEFRTVKAKHKFRIYRRFYLIVNLPLMINFIVFHKTMRNELANERFSLKFCIRFLITDIQRTIDLKHETDTIAQSWYTLAGLFPEGMKSFNVLSYLIPMQSKVEHTCTWEFMFKIIARFSSNNHFVNCDLYTNDINSKKSYFSWLGRISLITNLVRPDHNAIGRIISKEPRKKIAHSS